MNVKATRFASEIHALSTCSDLVDALVGRGRHGLAVELNETLEDSPWRIPGVERAWVVNPGEGAPIWVAKLASDPPTDGALDAELRKTARASRHGCAALFIPRDDVPELRLALANERRVLACRATRSIDERTAEAWHGFLDEPTAAAGCIRAWLALEKRELGRAFYADVRRVFRTVSDGWTGSLDVTERHTLSVGFLCRLMFLYFVQRRGWLDGDDGFLASLLLDPRADRLYESRLRPLFFDVLNRPAPLRTDAWQARAIPYLNGGLFERSPLENCFPWNTLPDEVVRELVEVLERYRFVGDEFGEEPGVDPAMLGTVFESLMHGDVRGRTGTFYTPPGLVAEVVDATLATALERRLGVLDAARVRTGDGLDALSDERRQEVAAIVDQLRIVDPSMGSGAFLLGALRHLVALRRNLTPDTDLHAATRRTIERNLYGVDASPVAVTIAGLRLWLALACTAPHDPAEVEPLPNLSHRLHCGDALFGPAVYQRLEGVAVDRRLVQAVTEASAAFAVAHGEQKPASSARLAGARRELAAALADARAARLEESLAQLESRKGPNLLGETRALTVAEKREEGALRRELDACRQAASAARAGTESPPFEFAVHFGDAVGAGGFDAVVGNPPWVRMSRLDAATRNRLKGAYRWIAGAGGGRAFGAQPDLSVAFVELAIRVAKDGGAVGMVVPSKLFTAGYATALRRGLVRIATPVRLRDLADSPVASFAAGVTPAVLVVERGRRSPCRIVVEDGSGRSGAADRHSLSVSGDPGAPWPLLDKRSVRLLRRLEDSFPALESQFDVRMGIKTGANAVFVDPPVREGAVRPMLRGGDVAPMRPRPRGQILFAHDPCTGAPLGRDALTDDEAQWIAANGEALRARSDFRPPDPEWTVFRVRPAALGHRVAWRDIGERLDACYLPPVVAGGPVAINTVYFAAVPDARAGRRLAAWLNTTAARFVAAAGAERALSGYRRFRAANVGRVPVPTPVVSGDDALDNAANQLADDPGSGTAWRLLDECAWRLLGMTSEEVATVKNDVARLSLHSVELAALLDAI